MPIARQYYGPKIVAEKVQPRNSCALEFEESQERSVNIVN